MADRFGSDQVERALAMQEGSVLANEVLRLRAIEQRAAEAHAKAVDARHPAAGLRLTPDVLRLDVGEDGAEVTPEELLARVRENVARARAERARTPGSRGLPGPDPDSGALSEDEERERSNRGR